MPRFLVDFCQLKWPMHSVENGWISFQHLFTFAAYSYMHHYDYDVSNLMWLPVVCLSFVQFISSAGISGLANTCSVENVPPNVCVQFIFLLVFSLNLTLLVFHLDTARWIDFLLTHVECNIILLGKKFSNFIGTNTSAWISPNFSC